MKHCPFCDIPWPDDHEVCNVCGTRLEDSDPPASVEPDPPGKPLAVPGGARPTAGQPPIAAPPKAPASSAHGAASAPAAKPAAPRFDGPPRQPGGRTAAGPRTRPAPGPRFERRPQPEPEAATRPDLLRPLPPEDVDRIEEPPAAEDLTAEKNYRKVVLRINRHLSDGFDLFGLVGHAASGKTHSLKALTYLLKRHGVGAQKAHVEFRQVPVPATSGGSITDYAYTGSDDEKWVFVDVGGELYFRMHNNDWTTRRASSLELSQWLNRCKGLFMYLHLNRGHFGQSWIDLEEELEDEETRDEVRRKRQKAREAQEELEFFKHFLLFLRALKHEGDVRKVIARCEQSSTLEEALRYYHTRAPLLDIPVMFFFTKADLYDEEGFEIADGLQMAPRQLPMATAAFVARHLPYLFSSLLSQVRRFKFDFLQSYEEHDTGQRDRGRPIKETHWSADDETLLSVGLLSGLEFILRNQTGQPWWQGPGLDTRRALLLHRILHPRQWKGVRIDLGGWGRNDKKAIAATAGLGEPPPKTPGEAESEAPE